jgi:hypothetical protein
LLTSPSSAGAGEICELSVKELVGAARVNEPVRMGIPLPKGVVKDVSELSLVDAGGRPIPCQFRAITHWLEDKSLRWVHAVFQTSVPAKGEVKVKLVKGKAASTAGKMKVTAAGNAVTVENGVLKLVVKGPGFNLFDSAWYDPAGKFGAEGQIVKPHGEGIVLTLAGKAYKPSQDSKVSVEEQGGEGAVIKVEGRLASGGDAPFTYVCYLHVFQGSPQVRATFAYTNASGTKPADHVKMEDLSVILPTTLAGSGRVGGEGKVFAGKAAKIAAVSSDRSVISLDGKEAGAAKGKSTKPKTIGWAALGSGKKSLAVGLRWFWQMFPRAVEADAEGRLRAGLFANEAGKPLDVYMGQGRTHYLTFLFGGGADAQLMDFFAGRQMPLRAVCTPKYYCRGSLAFGRIVDADYSLFPADLVGSAKMYDKALRESIDYIEHKIDGHTYGGVRVDSYGYYPWGDVFHWANSKGVKDPWNILWESNYYDYPWACLLQFARTGDQDYLDICDRHGLHLADVFMCKYHPKKHLCGACRYSPPANHVGLDKSYKTPQPYVSVEFNHHKALSILTRYLLLGDLRARDDFMLALNNARLNREGSWRQCRGPGAKLWTLTEGYRLLGASAEDVMAMMKSTVNAGRRHLDKKGGKGFGHSKGQFMYGHAAEGLIRYWWITGDEKAVETIKGMDDWLISADKVGAAGKNSAMSMAFLWRRTGEGKYREAALRLLRKSGKKTRPKSFGQEYRSTPYAWYFLSKLAEGKSGK